MSGFPYIFTFYSYKGGVGRSMALLNTAYTLASWGRHVLIVDMDLEAPGLSGFLHRHHELDPQSGGRSLDILTLLGQIVTEVKGGSKPKDIATSLPPLDGYLRSVAAEKLKPLAPKFGKVGRLDIVAADMERNWCDRLSALGLNELQQDQLIQVSSALHFYFKAHRFPHRPYGLEDFEPTEPTPYDYILIDSRTGITEVSGLCVGPVADRLVVLSGLNDQNVEGTRLFLKEAGIQVEPRTELSTPWDEADLLGQEEAPALGPKPTILVASPVPIGEIDLTRVRMGELEAIMGIQPLRLSYHAQMALFERVFVRDYKDEYLTGEYLKLSSRLLRQVSDHPTQILVRHQTKNKTNPVPDLDFVRVALRIATQDPDLGSSLLVQCGNGFKPESDSEYLAARRLHATLAELPEFRDVALMNWGNALSEQAKTKQGDEADRLWLESHAKYAEVIRIEPDTHDAFYNWGNSLSDQAKTNQGDEADRLWLESCAKYAETVRIRPDMHEAFNNWGSALSGQAKTKQGDEADRLWLESYAKYAEAIRIMPDKHDAFYNWGNALSDQAKTKQGDEADRLWLESCAKYAEAVRIKSDMHEAFNNWGAALSDHAKTKQGDKADRLWLESYAKYAEAIRIKPDKHGAFSNWGAALSRQAKTKQGDEADRLWLESYAKYAEAVRVKPDNHEALYNWGLALSRQAKAKQGDEADRLWLESYAKYAEAVRVKPDNHEAFYNWGNSLSDQAKTKQGDEADRLWLESYAKYAEAVRVKPDNHEAFYNWGYALSLQAKTKQGAVANSLWEQAYKRLTAAEEIQRGSAAYNLACLKALTKHSSEAVRWLHVVAESGDWLTAQKLAEDSDFDLIRDEPEFRSFVEGLPHG